MTSETAPATELKSSIPEWLNDQFFEDIFVEKHGLERGRFVVKVRAIIPTGGAGENYTSMLYRANVDAECEAVNCCIVPLPIAINEVTCDADFEGLTGSDERTRQFKRTVMGNKKYHKIIQALLPVFDRKGLLDQLK